MIEQYKKEMSEVHAPADLIERTREAVKKEEEKQQTEGRRGNITAEAEKRKKETGKHRGNWIAASLSAAAAVLVLTAVPFALKGAGTQEKTPALLGQENASDVQKIKNGMAADEPAEESASEIKVEIKMTEVSEIPEEFADAREVKQDGYTCLLLVPYDGTGFKAFVEKEGKGYLITGMAEDEEHFLQEAEKLIMEK